MILPSSSKERLFDFIQENCLITNKEDFALSSGIKSSVYFDCKRASLDGYALQLLSKELYEASKTFNKNYQLIGGLTLGADPIVAGMIIHCYNEKKGEIQGCIVRKKSKEHGTKVMIENNPDQPCSVLVVEDVTTTGNSAMAACEELVNAGHTLVGVVTIIDRELGGLEMIKTRYNVGAISLFKKSDFV